MRYALFFLVFSVFSLSVNSPALAQGCLWAKSAGGTLTGTDQATAVTTDAWGNVYMVGSFESDTITFGTDTLINAGANNIFIVKYDTCGNLLWAKNAGGTWFDAPLAVATDPRGNVYVGGYYSSPSITFGTTTLTNPYGTVSQEMFIARYDSAGNSIWAKGYGNYHEDGVTGIVTDTSGNIYMTGYFGSTFVDFDATTLTSAGGKDVFLVKYDSSGNLQWEKRAGGSGDDAAGALAIDPSGNLIIAGYFIGSTCIFGATTLTNAGLATTDGFLAKYTPTGSVVWANRVGGSADDKATSVATDTAGNIYMGGYFNSPVISLGGASFTNAGSTDGFLVQCNPAGSIIWANQVGGNDADEVTSVATDIAGNIYAGGYFASATLAVGTTTLTNNGSYDIFLAKYSPSAGNTIWARNAGGSGSDYSNTIATDAKRSMYIAGYFSSPTLTFHSTTLTNPGGLHVYIAKYDSSAYDPTLAVSEIKAEDANAIVFPNPASEKINLLLKDASVQAVTIYNCLGKKIYESDITGSATAIDVSALASGVYYLKASGNSFTANISFVILH